jgi:hypothetical protein
MLSFARDPQGFINDWLQSQCRDLKVHTHTPHRQRERYFWAFINGWLRSQCRELKVT